MKLNVPSIRAQMKRRQIESDTDLARAVGWSKAKMSRVLNSRQEVRDVLVQELAAALKCKEGDIVELDDVAQTEFQRAVLAGVRDAPPNVQEALRALLGIPPSVPSDD